MKRPYGPTYAVSVAAVEALEDVLGYDIVVFSLDAGLRKLVQDMVIANEKAVRTILLEESKTERATLAKEGMKFHTVPAAAVYSKLAVDSAYDRMVDRLKKAKRPTDHVAKLRQLWQQQ